MRNCLAAVVLFLIAAQPVGTAAPTPQKQTISGADGASIDFAVSDTELTIAYRAPNLNEHCAVFAALGTHREVGAAVLPFKQQDEGSTVFLPFKADLLLCAKPDSNTSRDWKQWKWADAADNNAASKFETGGTTFHIPRDQLGKSGTIDCIVYAKDLSVNDGWGKLFGCSDAD